MFRGRCSSDGCSVHDRRQYVSSRPARRVVGADEGRRKRLVRLGFPEADAAALSALHTRNFM